MKPSRDFGTFHRRHEKRNHLFRIFRNVARAFDFREYDAPVLEPLDLYIEKSGPEIASQLFHFEDKGERKVALRPELTPTLARMVAARANSSKAHQMVQHR